MTLDTKPPLRALLLENIHPDATARLTKAGYAVETRKAALSEDELIAALPGVSLLGIRSKTNVTARVLEAAPDLLAVGAFCIGTNQIDLAAASRARHRGLQRAVLQHPQRRRAGDRRDHLADPPADRQERRHARRASGTSPRLGRARDPRPAARHRRLRQHRRPAVRARRGARHVGLLLRHRRQARARQRARVREPRRAALVRRHRDAARRRPAGQRGHVRRGAVRPDAAGRVVPQPLPRLPRRPRLRCAGSIESRPLAGAAIDVFPERAEGTRRGVRLGAAGPAQRHPDAAHRRIDRRGPAGHRRVRRRQAARLPARRRVDR